MSDARKKDVESHRISHPQSPQQNDDEEEIFSDTKSQPSSPSQPASPASTPSKSARSSPANGAKVAPNADGDPASRILADKQSEADFQAMNLQPNNDSQEESSRAPQDPGDEQVVVKDLDTGRAVTVQKV